MVWWSEWTLFCLKWLHQLLREVWISLSPTLFSKSPAGSISGALGSCGCFLIAGRSFEPSLRAVTALAAQRRDFSVGRCSASSIDSSPHAAWTYTDTAVRPDCSRLQLLSNRQAELGASDDRSQCWLCTCRCRSAFGVASKSDRSLVMKLWLRQVSEHAPADIIVQWHLPFSLRPWPSFGHPNERLCARISWPFSRA